MRLEFQLYNFKENLKQLEGGKYSNIFLLNNSILIKEYLKEDEFGIFKDKDLQLLWEVEINNLLKYFGFSTYNIFKYFLSTNNINPILFMEKIDGKLFQDIINEKMEMGMDEYDLFLSKEYNKILKSYYLEKRRLNKIGFILEDSTPHHNVMYNLNLNKVFFYDFVGWDVNKKILNYNIKDFSFNFPLIASRFN